MAPYIIMNLFVSIFSSKEIFAPKFLNNSLIILLSLVLIIFVGLRFRVGGDWEPYVLIYQESNLYSLKSLILKEQDALFYTINHFVRITGFENGTVFINLIAATFIFFSFYRFIKFNNLNLISFVIFYPFIIIVLMGFLRQSIALGFLFLILSNSINKNIFINILYSLLAGQFHFSGYIFLIIPFVSILIKIIKITNYKNIIYLLTLPAFIFFIAIYYLPVIKYKLWNLLD